MKLSFNELTPAEEVGMTIAEQFNQSADFVHVQGLSLMQMEPEQRLTYIREASSSIGRLTLTANKPGSELWELNSGTSPNADFIPFHSDNPFYEEPEDIVGFWNIHSSQTGGENIILPGYDLVDWLHANPKHRELYSQLLEDVVEFTHKDAVAQGPILESMDGRVRYDQKYISDTHRNLGEQFSAALKEAYTLTHEVKLADGEALFFNNRTTLHARAPYNDTNRLSIRVRIAEVV